MSLARLYSGRTFRAHGQTWLAVDTDASLDRDDRLCRRAWPEAEIDVAGSG